MFSSQHLEKYQKKEAIQEYTKKIGAVKAKALEKFTELQEQVEQDLTKIDKTNLAGESNRNIHLYHTYLSRLTEEKFGLNDLKINREKIEGELFDFYRNHSDISSKLKYENAIAKYVYAHPCYIAINKLVKVQEALVSYLDGVITMVRDRGFAIKNVIEAVKIEMGMM